MKQVKLKIAFIGRNNAQGWANRAYTEIPFNKENNTTGLNLGFKPSAGKSLAIVHLDEATSRTVRVGDEINVHSIVNISGFVSFETQIGQEIANRTASKDASATDTLKRSIGIISGANVPETLLEVAFNKTFDALNASKVERKTARKGLRGNGLQIIGAQDAIPSPITEIVAQDAILNPITES